MGIIHFVFILWRYNIIQMKTIIIIIGVMMRCGTNEKHEKNGESDVVRDVVWN